MGNLKRSRQEKDKAKASENWKVCSRQLRVNSTHEKHISPKKEHTKIIFVFNIFICFFNGALSIKKE